MARLARVLAVDVPHHVTQGGRAQFILSSDVEKMVFGAGLCLTSNPFTWFSSSLRL